LWLGSNRAGTPRAAASWGTGRKKRGGASIPAAAVAWRGVALSAYPTGYHTMPCIPGVARVHDGWEWLSYSRTRRADGGTRTAARCTPRCGRLGSVFFQPLTPPVEPAAAGRAHRPYRFCFEAFRKALSTGQNDASTTLCTAYLRLPEG
jgi:hypothetical protein